MLRRALAEWERLPRAERAHPDPEALLAADAKRWERLYPEDGLVLLVYSRDLPRKRAPTGWHADARNQDYAWFRKVEISKLLPEPVEVGATAKLPENIVRRLVRLHLLDNVRGQTGPLQDEDIQRARWSLTVTATEGDLIELSLDGESRAVARGQWPVSGYQDRESPKAQERGMDLRWLGNFHSAVIPVMPLPNRTRTSAPPSRLSSPTAMMTISWSTA